MENSKQKIENEKQKIENRKWKMNIVRRKQKMDNTK